MPIAEDKNTLLKYKSQKFMHASMTLDKEYNSGYAMQALSELNTQAKRNGVADMLLDDINAEIYECREVLLCKKFGFNIGYYREKQSLMRKTIQKISVSAHITVNREFLSTKI